MTKFLNLIYRDIGCPDFSMHVLSNWTVRTMARLNDFDCLFYFFFLLLLFLLLTVSKISWIVCV